MKRTFLGVLLLYLACIILPAQAAIIDSGTCGSNLTWTLTDDGTLTISGTGEMDNYDYDVSSPWFSHRGNIKTARIEQGVTSIGDVAFDGCSGLTSINIPESVTSIGDGAFASCSSLTAINIPEGVTSIGGSAFYGCNGLSAINIPESVTSIGVGAFTSCYNLTAINIPESVTSIGDGAFMGCYNLTAITIPESVTSIGGLTFRRCSGLTAITIPESVTSIGDGAFYGCNGLTQMTVLGTTPPAVGIDALSDVSRDIPVYVPEESLTAYKNADVWKEFNLQALSSTGLHTPVLPESIRVYDGMLHNPQGLSVRLYDMQGSLVYSGTATVLSMPAGVYVLQCGKASGKVMFP